MFWGSSFLRCDVCMYINTHTCALSVLIYVHTYMYVCMDTYIHTYVCKNLHTYIHTYIRIYIHTYIHTYHLRICLFSLIYPYTYIKTYIHTYIHTYICIYIRIYICMYVYTYIPLTHMHSYLINTYTYMKRYIHTYIRIYKAKFKEDVKTRSKHSDEDVIYGIGGLIRT